MTVSVRSQHSLFSFVSLFRRRLCYRMLTRLPMWLIINIKMDVKKKTLKWMLARNSCENVDKWPDKRVIEAEMEWEWKMFRKPINYFGGKKIVIDRERERTKRECEWRERRKKLDTMTQNTREEQFYSGNSWALSRRFAERRWRRKWIFGWKNLCRHIHNVHFSR